MEWLAVKSVSELASFEISRLFNFSSRGCSLLLKAEVADQMQSVKSRSESYCSEAEVMVMVMQSTP